jgi:hypothetical protein
VTSRQHLVRALWTLFEPVHALTYFSAESRTAFADIGFPRYWDGYFAGRSAPLGAVNGPAVTAIFSGFAPALVERALPAAWQTVSPADALEARAVGAAASIRALVDDDELVRRAADALVPIARAADTIGRPLSAANRALPEESEPYRALWQAATTLREHRGDGHVVALVTEGISGLSTIILRSGFDLDGRTMQKARGWSDEEWTSESAALTARGLIAADGSTTEGGAAAIARAEELTNRLAVDPWHALDDERLLEVAALLHPIAVACSQGLPHPNPIGASLPWDPSADPEARMIAATPERR